jgi:hypothetical protein
VSSDILDIYYFTISIETEPLLGNRCLNRVLGIKDLVEFLELLHVSIQAPEEKGKATYSSVLRLRDEEVDDRGLYSAPDGEDNICAPSDLVHGNWPSELVQHTSSSDGETGEAHSLSAHLER